ncbi:MULTISPECIES: DUF924 family protein [unclassified Agarivorans]|uniref:DUF924 family protein n=1 Tax=unclassified Agarivorans TaxID=2636026 RepID=UPI003D7EAF4A
MEYQAILEFWFEHLQAEQRFVIEASVDLQITESYSGLLQSASFAELWAWRDSAKGSLAEVIVLDQFSRHIHRGSAQAFACDPLALALAQNAVAKQFDQRLTPTMRAFLYMPYMHSESLVIHQQAEQLFHQPGLEQQYQFELKHKTILEKFGRYPHRNQILGRQSSAAELAFLAGPNSSF